MDLGDQSVRNLRKLENEDVLLGQMNLFGRRVHVIFLRVGEETGMPTNDPYNRWQALVESEAEGEFETIDVPGFEGQYVFFTNSNVR